MSAWHVCEFYGGPVDGLQLALLDIMDSYRFAVHDPLPVIAPRKDDEPPEMVKVVQLVYRRRVGTTLFDWVGYYEGE
jgi:hypothetical protein